jgi:hypothetical protein
MRTTMTLGGVVAIGIGLGVALAASMGAAGYAVGLGAAVLAFWARPGLRGRTDPEA